MSAPTFPTPAPGYDAPNERAFRDQVSRLIQELGRASAPDVNTNATRAGQVVTLTHTITDPSRVFRSMEFQFNGGGWVTTWDTVVAGVSYVEAITLTPGTDSIYEWRMGYSDESGQRQYKSGTMNLADLQSVTKTLIISFPRMVPAQANSNQFKGLGYVASNTDDSMLWSSVADVDDLPVGAIVTGFRVRAREGSSGNVGPETIFRYINASDAITVIGDIDHSGEATTAWKSDNSSLPHTIQAEFAYYLIMAMQWTTAEANAPRWYRAEITYIAPDYSKTR